MKWRLEQEEKTDIEIYSCFVSIFNKAIFMSKLTILTVHVCNSNYEQLQQRAFKDVKLLYFNELGKLR